MEIVDTIADLPLLSTLVDFVDTHTGLGRPISLLIVLGSFLLLVLALVWFFFLR